MDLPTPSLTSLPLRMSYRISRGEKGVLTFEPYKSHLLPYWKFRTPEIARTSSSKLWDCFKNYRDKGDFVGCDMVRKFLQMGMTRARRYGKWKGGRKYKEVDEEGGDGKGEVNGGMKGKGERELVDEMEMHEGSEEKNEASRIFKEVWERVKRDERYGELKGEFQKEQREWDREEKKRKAKKKREGNVDGDGDENGDGDDD